MWCHTFLNAFLREVSVSHFQNIYLLQNVPSIFLKEAKSQWRLSLHDRMLFNGLCLPEDDGSRTLLRCEEEDYQPGRSKY